MRHVGCITLISLSMRPARQRRCSRPASAIQRSASVTSIHAPTIQSSLFMEQPICISVQRWMASNKHHVSATRMGCGRITSRTGHCSNLSQTTLRSSRQLQKTRSFITSMLYYTRKCSKSSHIKVPVPVAGSRISTPESMRFLAKCFWHSQSALSIIKRTISFGV